MRSQKGIQDGAISLPSKASSGLGTFADEAQEGASRIPKDHWQPSYGDSSEQDKENVPVASGSRPKRPALESAGSLPQASK
ncbi:hypothetical protein BDR03DRAFT_1016887 [Suillus americanus]|nr:hypothetical protein BDR03DRAFT_1016887 [Suillus americanus]